METKKVYRIIDKRTDKAVSLGYNRKSSWRVFPAEAIRNSIPVEEQHNYFVEEYVTVLSKRLTLDRKEIGS